ncbi:MAG: translation initiation factor IF-6 [Candidatus Micrarchaeaceae archaeon]
MGVAKYSIRGTDYIGAYSNACDSYAIVGVGLAEKVKSFLFKFLKVRIINFSSNGSDMAGIYARGNSNGVVVSNITRERELAALKAQFHNGENICLLKSNVNAVGNNILANDKIALVNPEYEASSVKEIRNALGVETLRMETGRFKTVGANNILTNKGIAVNNRSTDEELEEIEKLTGFKPVMTTANTGGLGIGLGTISNSNGLLTGYSTTGFELTRLMDALNIEDD